MQNDNKQMEMSSMFGNPESELTPRAGKQNKAIRSLTNQHDLRLSHINNNGQLLPLIAPSHTTSFTVRYTTRPSKRSLLYSSSSIFIHSVAGGYNMHLVVCHVKSLIDLTLWLCWSGTANVGPPAGPTPPTK